MPALTSILKKYSGQFHNVMPFDPADPNAVIFDFTDDNAELAGIDLNNEALFSAYIDGKIEAAGASYGIGKYNENRTIYQRSPLFQEESRSLHLGIDIWAPAGTPVFAPADGEVHSFADNNHHGDYGPTILLKHQLEGIEFYTLYGHLSKTSLDNLFVGKPIKSGELFATYGAYEENVHWPPHLHFQVIQDVYGYKGDFPGVCKPHEADRWLSNCPNPNLMLNLKVLEID